MSATERTTLERALLAIRELKERLRSLEEAESEPIAIIGAGCRMPPSLDDPSSLWTFLVNGGDAVRPPPPTRRDLAPSPHLDPEDPARPFQRSGGYLATIDTFDAAFFGVAPREAVSLDPQQRLLLETSYEALEDAGLAIEALEGSATGVFVGAGTEDYAQLGLRSGDGTGNDAYAFTGSDLSLAAGRVAYSFGFQGPALVVDTACSSSLVALHLAVRSLRQRESSLALAAGVNLAIGWDIGLSLCQARALAPDGRCKTFDAAADGYGRGEGCAVLVLKRLRDALTDGDRVLALVLGSAVNQDGASSGLTAPNGLAQAALVRSALRDARVQPREVGYVEAHGTGTPLGDPIEVGALAAALSVGRSSTEPLLLGSVKTQLGHLEAAAGLTGVLKVALALRHEVLPPTLHFREQNAQLELDAIPARVVAQPHPWPRSEGRRVAGVSSFGISGTNAHAVLAEAPPVVPEEPEAGALTAARTGTLLTLSARSEAARRDLVDRYRAWLRAEGAAEDIDALCAEAARRRTHHPFRLGVAARSTPGLLEALDAYARGEATSAVAVGSGTCPGPGPVFVFDGQGGQWPRMGCGLLERSAAARDAAEAFDAAFRRDAGWSVLGALRDPSEEAMAATCRAQPALTVIQIALTEHWRSLGVRPAAIVGHSAGEVAAAYAAGALSLEDAARVALHRGRLMQRSAGTGAMATIDLPADAVERLAAELGGAVSIAAVNAPSTTVVSGSIPGVEALIHALAARGATPRRIAVDLAAHSAEMDPILEELEESLRALRPTAPTVPFWSTSQGERVAGAECGPRFWARNVRNVVQFSRVMSSLFAQGATTFVDVGPHPILALPISQCAEAAGRDVEVVASMRREADELDTLASSVAALYARGEPLDLARLFGRRRRASFDLPRHPWRRERYWLDRASTPARLTPRAACAGAEEGPGRELLHRVEWELAPSPPLPPTDARGSWIILADRGGVGRALARELRSRGGEVSLVFLGHGESPDPQESFVDLGSPELLARALRAALPPLATGAAPRLVHLWNLDLGAFEEAGAGSGREGWQRVWRAASGPLTALSRLADRAAPQTWVATRGSQDAGGRGGDRVLGAMAWALWGSAAFEHQELAVRRVDLDVPAEPARDVAALLLELLGPGGGPDAIAHRGDLRAEPRLVAAPTALGAPRIRNDATYLLTGGLGALGLSLAEALVSQGARYLALVGRRGPDAAATSRIAALERAGATVRVLAADVSDRGALAQVLEQIDSPSRPLRGIVHAAAVLVDGVVLGQPEDTYSRVVSPKVAGALHLHALTEGWPLDFFLLFSSIAGTLSPPGQASYAAANA
ncbi:MAG TPA: type I polyketide synthase, partial [Polyangiaceae bacterium]